MLARAMASDPAEDLFRRTRSGDRTALETLLQQHLPAMRAFVRSRMSALLRARESAEDLVQSACRQVLGKLADFEYRGEEAFRGWLFTAVLHVLRHHERDLRREKRDARREAAVSDLHALSECYRSVLSPSAHALADESVRALEAAFDALPDDYREVISLSRFARLSRAEIARTMGRSEDSVRSLLPRALAALAAAIDRGQRATGS